MTVKRVPPRTKGFTNHPWREGWRAHEAGKPVTSSPFSTVSQPWSDGEWTRGWFAANNSKEEGA